MTEAEIKRCRTIALQKLLFAMKLHMRATKLFEQATRLLESVEKFEIENKPFDPPPLTPIEREKIVRLLRKKGFRI